MTHPVEAFRSWLRRWLEVPAPPAPAQPPAPPDPEDPASWQSLDYIEAQVTSQLKQQHDIWDSVDGRLRLVLGVVGIVFAAALGFQRGQNPLTTPVGVLTMLAVAGFLGAAAVVAWAYWPRDFDWPPRPAGIRELVLLDPRETKLQVIDTIIQSYNLNEQIIAFKIRWFKLAFLLTAGATALLGIAIVVHVWGQTAGLGAPTVAPTPTATPVAPSLTPAPIGGGAIERPTTQEPSQP
jgi:hypothetical protein